MEVKVGRIYRHFKGNYYKVFGVSLHTETGESLVLYRRLIQDAEDKTTWLFDEVIWARPEQMFLSTKEVNGEEIQRFVEVNSLPLE